MTFAENQKIGEWSILKLKFLESYLESYLKATKKAKHKYYIDCFAGRSFYINKGTNELVPGSTIRVLNLKDHFDAYHFIELDPARIADLEKLKEQFPERKIFIHQGDCNVILPQILPEINKSSPVFLFFDTDGINIDWKTLELSSKWKSEFLINFPFYMSLKRNMPWDENKMQKTSSKLITKFYGTEEWKTILYAPNKTKLQKNSELIQLYEKNLRKLGFSYVLFSDTFSTSSGNKLYYLVFAGNHPVGEKIMKHVFYKQFNPQRSLFE